MKISKLIIATCLLIIMTLPTLSGSLPFKEIEYSYEAMDTLKSTTSNMNDKCTFKHRIIFRKNKLYYSQFQQRCKNGTYNHSIDEGIVFRLGKSYRSKFTCKTAKNANYRNCSNGTRTSAIRSTSSSRSSYDEKYTSKWDGDTLQLDFKSISKGTIRRPGKSTLKNNYSVKQNVKIAFKNGKCAVVKHQSNTTFSGSTNMKLTTILTKPVYCKIRR